MHCLALLYSAVKTIVKPLVEYGQVIGGIGNYLVLDNLWFRDHSCFFFLCKRKDTKNVYKTEQASRFKNRTLAVQDGNITKEQLIVSGIGVLFWEAFFPNV